MSKTRIKFSFTKVCTRKTPAIISAQRKLSDIKSSEDAEAKINKLQMDKEILDYSISLENFFREVGLVYKTLQTQDGRNEYSYLPNLVADFVVRAIL